MFMQTVSACLFVLVTNSAWSQDEEHTCSDLLNRQTDRLNHCTFENSDTVRCDILDKVTDHDNLYDHFFYLHVMLGFKVKEPYNSSYVCLGMSSLLIDRVSDKKPWENATIGELPSHIYTFLRYIKYGLLKVDFKNMFPAATLVMNEDCVHHKDKDCNPIHHVNFLLDLKRPATTQNLFDPEYWEQFRKWFKPLGGFDTELQLDFDVQYGTIKPSYLSNTFKGIDMRYLRFTGGNWGHLDKRLLDTLKTLKILDLSNNQIDTISDDTFIETLELEVLVLSDNLLKGIPVGIGNLKHLQKLDLSDNPIKTDIGFAEIITLSSLRHLNLAHIKFNDLDNLKPLFSTCENELQLETLNLSHCNIQSLNNDDFRCQKGLKVLDLSHNKLKEIPSEIVSAQKYLEALNISNNILTNSPHIIMNEYVHILDISENRLYDLNNLIQSGKVKFLDLSKNNFSVWSSVNVFDDHIKNMNISHNSISYFSNKMIRSLGILESVDLGANSYDCSDCTLPEFQNWLRTENRTKIYNLGSEESLTCSVPVAKQGKFVESVNFDETLCLTNYSLVVGVPITVMLLVIAVSIGIIYFYRFEITYLVHLVNMKRGSVRSKEYYRMFKYDAFVCYSGSDRAWVIGQLMPTLESKPDKYCLCVHERDFPLGSFITDNIVGSLQSSRNTIVVLTDNFIRSEWCQWELELANHKVFENSRKFLILIELEKLDRTSLPQNLKYLMDTRTYLEWPQNKEDISRAWKRLKEALGPSIHQCHNEAQGLQLLESQNIVLNI